MTITWLDILKEEVEKIVHDELFICPKEKLHVAVHYTCDGDPDEDDPIITVRDGKREEWIGQHLNYLVEVHIVRHWEFIEVEYHVSSQVRFNTIKEQVSMKDPDCLDKVLGWVKKALSSDDTINHGDLREGEYWQAFCRD
jgi:hypothetical protein